MVDKRPRLLKPNEIEIRVGNVNKDGCQFLLYKNARVDRQILTEIYGDKWKNSFDIKDGLVYCTISVYNDELKEWISREDCGIESKQQDDNRFKAQASDAFKRASFKFGIGEELYSATNLFVKKCTTIVNNKYELQKEYKYLDVTIVDYDNNNNITKVVCKNKYKTIIFTKNGNYFNGNVIDDTQDKQQTAENIQNEQQTYSNTIEHIKNIVRKFKLDIKFNIKNIDDFAERVKFLGDKCNWTIFFMKNNQKIECKIDRDKRLVYYIENELIQKGVL